MYVYYSNVYIDYYTKQGILYLMYVLKSLFYSFIEKKTKRNNSKIIFKRMRKQIDAIFFVMGITCAFRTKGIKKTHTHIIHP